jgi:hypothetical protein
LKNVSNFNDKTIIGKDEIEINFWRGKFGVKQSIRRLRFAGKGI